MLAEQKRAGKIRHLGVSILGKGSESQAREARPPGAGVLQVIYNRLDRRAETEVFPTPAAQPGHPGPRPAGQRLAQRQVRSPATSSGRTTTARRWETRRSPGASARRRSLPTRSCLSASPGSRWALAWCLRDPVVAAVIPGAKSPEQVAENASAADLLSEKMP